MTCGRASNKAGLLRPILQRKCGTIVGETVPPDLGSVGLRIQCS